MKFQTYTKLTIKRRYFARSTDGKSSSQYSLHNNKCGREWTLIIQVRYEVIQSVQWVVFNIWQLVL